MIYDVIIVLCPVRERREDTGERQRDCIFVIVFRLPLRLRLSRITPARDTLKPQSNDMCINIRP